MAIVAKAMPLRRVVIKEELVALTGDFMEALVLNQLLDWSQRARDYVQLMAEELKRGKGGMDSAADWQPVHGWIYKKSDELANELMVGCSATTTTIRRVMNRLLVKGLLWERNNPDIGWDKTKQYRVNLLALSEGLAALGYQLEGFELSTGSCGQTVVRQGSGLQAAGSKLQDAAYGGQAVARDAQTGAPEAQAGAAIPKITPDITAKNKKNTQRHCASTGAAQAADSNTSLSRGAAQALVQTINLAPPALYDQAYQNVRWRLQSHGYDIDCASDGLFFLRE